MKKLFFMVTVFFILSTSVALAGVQEDRLAYINKLTKQGYFQKVEVPGELPHVWVTPRFYGLSFDDKQAFISVVYAYYIGRNKKSNIVVLRDSRTNEKVGIFSKEHGGLRLFK